MKYNDEDAFLVDMVCETNEEVRNSLYEKYAILIKSIVKKYKSKALKIGLDLNDLIQEANLGFTDAINKYDATKEASLKTFISLCIERRLIKVIERQSTEKNKIVQESLSLDYEYLDQGLPLKEIIGDDRLDPSKTFTAEENCKQINKKVEKYLSKLEYSVYTYMIKGLNYHEIAKLLDKNPKQIDNTMQRVRMKLKDLLKGEEK